MAQIVREGEILCESNNRSPNTTKEPNACGRTPLFSNFKGRALTE